MVWHGMKSFWHDFMYSFYNRLSPSTLSVERKEEEEDGRREGERRGKTRIQPASAVTIRD